MFAHAQTLEVQHVKSGGEKNAKTGMEEDHKPHPGPSGLSSGLSIHATVALTIVCARNGRSSNGSSDTPQQPRKRPRRPETWKRAAAKAKRARGEEYVSPSTGKTVTARKTGPPCSCKQKCFDRFTLGERADVVRSFYDLDDKDLHLFGLNAVKRRRPRAGGKTPKLATYTYTVSAHAQCVTKAGMMPHDSYL